MRKDYKVTFESGATEIVPALELQDIVSFVRNRDSSDGVVSMEVVPRTVDRDEQLIRDAFAAGLKMGRGIECWGVGTQYPTAHDIEDDLENLIADLLESSGDVKVELEERDINVDGLRCLLEESLLWLRTAGFAPDVPFGCTCEKLAEVIIKLK